MHLLGIDLGTSSVKALLIDAESTLPVASAACEYPIYKPQLNFAEQDPADWWSATVGAVRQVMAETRIDPATIGGIGLSGQMHGLVCLDIANQVIRPAIIWADGRSHLQVKELLARSYAAEIAEHAPGWPAAGFLGLSLMWLAEHEPEIYRRTWTALLPKDYLRLCLTGQIATDATDAAGTWLFDIATGKWSEWLFDLCGLDMRFLPPVFDSTDIVAGLRPEAAAELGLPAGIPVAAGSADLPAQALGHGVIDPGTDLVIIGTGGQVFHPLIEPLVDPSLRVYVYNHAAPGRWYTQAAILSAGLSLRWLRDTLGLANHPNAYAHLSALAEEVPPGADGLIFVPHLAGTRSPRGDVAKSGAFIGLQLHHGPGHLTRAVMEGVTYAMALCLSTVKELSNTNGLQVIASGGANRSALWRQIQADVYGVPLMLSDGKHHAGVGAALMAGVGVGVYDSIGEACARLPEPRTQVMPGGENAELYQELFGRYRMLVAALFDNTFDG